MLHKNYKNILGWKNILRKEFSKNYFINMERFLEQQYNQYHIYPKKEDIFYAFKLCSLKNIKVVIIGQDPYHKKDQANGLSFSVPKGVKIPASLRNIFKEINNDLNIKYPLHGDLSNWAKQGVLLLNSTLTVKEKNPNSHYNKGWEQFTDKIINTISTERKGVVFLLWGKFAQQKEKLININTHHILKAPHPSPFSVHKGFFGCKHFSKTNKLLISQDKDTINWRT